MNTVAAEAKDTVQCLVRARDFFFNFDGSFLLSLVPHSTGSQSGSYSSSNRFYAKNYCSV